MAGREATGQLRLTVFLTASESRTTVKPQKEIFFGTLRKKTQDGKCRLTQTEQPLREERMSSI